MSCLTPTAGSLYSYTSTPAAEKSKRSSRCDCWLSPRYGPHGGVRFPHVRARGRGSGRARRGGAPEPGRVDRRRRCAQRRRDTGGRRRRNHRVQVARRFDVGGGWEQAAPPPRARRCCCCCFESPSLLLRISVSAPASTRRLTASTRVLSAAKCSGVAPCEFVASTSAPFRSRKAIASVDPQMAATCRAVCPKLLVPFTSI
jgi:hypothetical protein